jgi:UDP:flavonoid glycosyltransferase YjiC (YdhE family)
MVATAGRAPQSELHSAIFAAPFLFAVPFLSGSAAARRARFVVRNGGSPTSYQALAAGKPVLGIASNLDPYVATTAVRDASADILLRADSFTAATVTHAAETLPSDPTYATAAQHIATELTNYNCHTQFASTLQSLSV